MAMPFEHRIPGGQWRYLQLRSLRDYLPDAIINRADQTTFEEYVLQILATAVPRWQSILFATERWESAPYVNRRDASQLFTSYRGCHSPLAHRFRRTLAETTGPLRGSRRERAASRRLKLNSASL
jgi:hypothetical protein